MTNRKTAIIFGAGPAGLTAAYELLSKTDILPVIYEVTAEIGGISKTVNYKGNRIDIGGHRFFSKVDRIVNWWLNILPMQGYPARDYKALGIAVPLARYADQQRLGESVAIRSEAPDPEQTDQLFLWRHRLSRIYFLRKFYDYPVRLSMNTFRNLGLVTMFGIAASYLQAIITPIKPEKSLEDFFINRFGRRLYRIFFKDYTEKVWGVSCNAIKSEWGAQRIKGLSVARALIHYLKKKFSTNKSSNRMATETSLIEQFMYPKFGPGQLWEEVAAEIVKNGGILRLNSKVVGIQQQEGLIRSITIVNSETGSEQLIHGDYFLSSMPVKDLIAAMGSAITAEAGRVASQLQYRDFITVGLLVDKLMIKNQTTLRTINDLVPDNWIYIQESSVKLGRIQIFNNWSPYMVQDPDKVWLGLEYFCQEGDSLWSLPDSEMIEFAGKELAEIGIISRTSIRDGIVIRVPKAYPAYFGSYDEFEQIRKFTDGFANLFLIGRNGMHRYNNMDHSMMTAMIAVENIVNNRTNKDNIWQVNTDEWYQEQK